jgi:hypothetical protein
LFFVRGCVVDLEVVPGVTVPPVVISCPTLGPEQCRAHASDLEVLGSWLAHARQAGRRIGQDQSAFGPLCGWVLTGLADRYRVSQERVAFIEENLVLAAQSMRRVGAGQERLADWLGVCADGTVIDQDLVPVPYDGSESLSHVMDGVLDWIRDREWVEPGLAAGAPVAEFAAPVDEAFRVLRAAGVDCAIACVEPVRQMLHDLSGAPEVIADQAKHWDAMAADLQVVGVELRDCLTGAFGGWARPDVRAYLDLMSNNVEGLLGFAAIAATMAVVTRSAGDLLLLTRDIVRGLIGDLFARVIVWVADTTAVVSLPVLTGRLAAVVATTWRIHFYLKALVTSVANLSECLEG